MRDAMNVKDKNLIFISLWSSQKYSRRHLGAFNWLGKFASHFTGIREVLRAWRLDRKRFATCQCDFVNTNHEFSLLFLN